MMLITFNDRVELVKSLCCAGDVGAEIGVLNGDFSGVLAATKPKKLFLIDAWQRQEGEYEKDIANAWVGDAMYESVVHRFVKDYNVIPMRAWSLEAAGCFPDAFFDWIYLDADHTREAFRSDLGAWWGKIKKGGLLLGHDYCNEPHIQVKEVLADYKLDYLTLESSYPSWGIRV
jgi:hypothetical protein